MSASRAKKRRFGQKFFTIFSLSTKVGVPTADVSGT